MKNDVEKDIEHRKRADKVFTRILKRAMTNSAL